MRLLVPPDADDDYAKERVLSDDISYVCRWGEGYAGIWRRECRLVQNKHNKNGAKMDMKSHDISPLHS